MKDARFDFVRSLIRGALTVRERDPWSVGFRKGILLSARLVATEIKRRSHV